MYSASRHFQQWLYFLFELLLILPHSLLCLHLRLSTTTTIEYNFLKSNFFIIQSFNLTHPYVYLSVIPSI
ncbi:uncharacterized protein BX664DRAFT_325166 [Halteromyces radiatus]|uniref:uncharacterized protein n=1 Tax=Halteromyces radiatus TaxID=101107 RepID=UPI00221E833B|nr:uncharacterized protein BX664DRAFT_325166 [Halteromyces radiatus]KAI8096917.1 hypothetical protein BX664DRAFT_325166 [Halteromyces radiatus]